MGESRALDSGEEMNEAMDRSLGFGGLEVRKFWSGTVWPK